MVYTQMYVLAHIHNDRYERLEDGIECLCLLLSNFFFGKGSGQCSSV